MYEPSVAFERMTPVVSAAETEPGVITTALSSEIVVRSPATRRIAGARLFTPAPVQSVIWIFTGSTWPFRSLSVTGWFVIGGRNAPVPTPTVVVFVSKPPSLSVIFTVAVWLQPADEYVCVWEKAPCALYVCVAVPSATPSQLQVAIHGLSSVPGSLNEPLNVVGTKTSGPKSPVLVPEKLVMTGGRVPTVILKGFWPEPPSFSVTLPVHG